MSIVVIGGGVIGYSVAHALAERGAPVQVVDMRGPGCGATRASAGMLAPYIEGHDDTLLKLGVASLAMYDGFLHRVDADAGQTTEYSRSGTLQIAQTRRHSEELSRASVRLSRQQVAHHLLTDVDIRALEPLLATDVQNGLLVPTHGYVHVPQLMTALTRAASRRGVTSRLDRVLKLVAKAGRVQVIGEDATLDAEVVVVAAGSWSGQLEMPPSVLIPVRPIRGQSLELGFQSPQLSHIVWGDSCYLVPWQNGSMIVGATVEDVGFDEASTAEGIGFLQARAEAVLPSAASAPVREVRVGLRPATVDELPLVGWSSTIRGVCLATGHYRNGILLAPLTAKLVADLVLGVEDAETRWATEAVAPSRLGL